jgi:hypothetical protein
MMMVNQLHRTMLPRRTDRAALSKLSDHLPRPFTKGPSRCSAKFRYTASNTATSQARICRS